LLQVLRSRAALSVVNTEAMLPTPNDPNTAMFQRDVNEQFGEQVRRTLVRNGRQVVLLDEFQGGVHR